MSLVGGAGVFQFLFMLSQNAGAAVDLRKQLADVKP
jgi:hypothetical protein